MAENDFIKAIGINYQGTLPKIKKSNDPLQPIYEAFTNSLESIRSLSDKKFNGQIIIQLKLKSNLFSNAQNTFDFDEISIIDTGIGFNEQDFLRMENLNDNGKGFLNKGSGRVQFLHFFDRSTYLSIYKDESSKTGYKERSFILSKSDTFLKHNAIILNKTFKDIPVQPLSTSLTFRDPLNDKDKAFYERLSVDTLKDSLISHYLGVFCENRNALPEIKLQYFENDDLKQERTINAEDIPVIDQQKDLHLSYYKISSDDGSPEKIDKEEILNLKAFKVVKDKLPKNGLYLTSKGELVKDIKLDYILSEDYINDNRYLFLISGRYLDIKVNETRGDLTIPTFEEFKKSSEISTSLFSEEEILLDDIQEKANECIILMYNEIKSRREEKKVEIDNLQKMFLLNPETVKNTKIKLNDSDDKILEKIYQADAKVIAKNDAVIKEQFERLNVLDTTSKDYNELLEKEVNQLVKLIPLQNRTALTHYVARRKIVLQLFNKILEKQLQIQAINTRQIDEKLLHNLIFQQSSDQPDKSDLWLINEDFIYFSGTSEGRLGDISINNIKILKENLSEEEIKYRDSLEEKRYEKRPDVLLFPDEGKCIIIEFKSPDVNVSDHLNQISNYAGIIRNLSREEFKFSTFYGYLIGEKMDAMDIQNKDPYFESAFHFDYVFRPHRPVRGFFGRPDGSLYTEAISYSTLLKRAVKRNEIFIDKLTKQDNN